MEDLKFTERLVDNYSSLKEGCLIAHIPRWKDMSFHLLLNIKKEYTWEVLTLMSEGGVVSYMWEEILRNSNDWYILK